MLAIHSSTEDGCSLGRSKMISGLFPLQEFVLVAQVTIPDELGPTAPDADYRSGYPPVQTLPVEYQGHLVECGTDRN